MLKLRGVGRAYPSGDGEVEVLKGVDLDIGRGEFVAIVGQSGSGKSTLMNILGCLDRPSSGSYEVNGVEISMLEPDDLSRLRREHFGFIFQRYHLLPELNAIGNVEIPAIYAGLDASHRRERAVSLLERLGLGDRTTHRPGQLSGGQQQRVSIARALMNGADVILADEPTGALDSQSGADVLAELKELHRSGKTIILVTHDTDIAATAERIIEIRDGLIISDSANLVDGGQGGPSEEAQTSAGPSGRAGSQMNWFRSRIDRAGEALRMAVRSMLARKVRALLTMLGIIIGIASVVCVVALGTGSQQKVLANISSLGTNTLEIFPGKDFGDMRSGKITTLVVGDADQLARQPYVSAVTPTVSTSATLRHGNVEATGQISGVGEGYFVAKGLTLQEGRFFDGSSVTSRQPDGVIDENTRKSLFADHIGSVIGQVILADNVPVRVVGVVAKQQGFGDSQNLSVYLPYTTVQTRLLGSTSLRSITVRVSDQVDMSLAEQAVTDFLTRRHGTKDFFILNTDDIRKTITSTTQTLALLISAIAVIALIVGGIGVMNIMLVTVSERISEIGVRMAVGARQGDILQQFLIEAVLVCLIGGILGIGVALAFGYAFSLLSTDFKLVYSTQSMAAAFAVSSLIGVVFGYLPARNAARLDPVAALSGTR
ncbi:MacB family efflux pump subunit [Roseibium suaedae]|uniref:Pyoverdine export ATP-binding/permease protein PvdT n=1 Tax=Roseibium suaedae TaxID=735517 RepID=A0A1M7I9R1_9HYPH|nr:MacB family efflux pump subunit [Roseibium suaedae]SHM37546.1 macrolide transport system ATP-binding/permease protein [Roseibium suaedae]